MPDVNPYLFFGGNCAEAMRFYEKALNGKIDMMMTHKESPAAAQSPAGSDDLIMHAHLSLGGNGAILASDDMPNANYRGMHGFTVSLTYPTAEESKRIFDALADGGKVAMPFGETFWSPGFGMLSDRFGTPWMINTCVPNQ